MSSGRTHQLHHVGKSTYEFKVISALQLFRQRDDVYRLTLFGDCQHRLINACMRLTIEVIPKQQLTGTLNRSAFAEQHRA